MGNLKVKKTVSLSNVKIVNPNILRPQQKIYLYQQILDEVSLSLKTMDDRIMVAHAPTNSGKTFCLINVTIPAMIQQNPFTTSIVFTSPDSGCVDGPYAKFHAAWHNQVIVNCLGHRVRIRVMNGKEFNEDLVSGMEFVSAEPVVEVYFLTTQMLGLKWGDYLKNGPYNLLAPTFVIVDEIHYGMGTIGPHTIKLDQGRTNKNYNPHWLPILIKMAKLGSRIVGVTGTPTYSQFGTSIHGTVVFNKLKSMPKEKDSSAFVEGWTNPNPTDVYASSKDRIEKDLVQLDTLLGKITDDTWEKAADIGIDKKKPGALFKFGQHSRASANVSLSKIRTEFEDWATRTGADYGIATTTRKLYQKVGKNTYGSTPNVPKAINVINEANDPANFSVPVFLGVIQQGNMGWDIPRIKYISAMTHPTGKGVTNMQQQLMARGNRLPFDNMYSHNAKANEIASLDITVDQKNLLAEYVVFMCSTVVYFSRSSELMKLAYNEFQKETHTPVEGMKIYMDAIANYVPKNNVTAIPKPRFTKGYSAGSLNQDHKKCYCEACMAAGSIDPVTGKTICEIQARKVREFERGTAFSDDEWAHVWFHTLVVDHKDGDRNNYNPDNLITRDPTNNGVKTYDAKDYLNKYDASGKRIDPLPKLVAI
jgi:hypothetical protein